MTGRNSTFLPGIAAIVLFMLAGHPALAGSIPLGNSGWEAQFDNGLDALVNIVVDDETASAVFIQKFATYTQPPVEGGYIPPLNIVFRQTRATTVTSIVLNREVITNSTGADWINYHFEIAGGSADAEFDPVATANSGGPGPIGFDISPFTKATFSPDNQMLDVSGGTVLNGTKWFPGGGPSDGQLWISVHPTSVAPFTVFSLKERPGVPEPAGLGLLALGALATRRRRA